MSNSITSVSQWIYLLILVPVVLALTFIPTPVIQRKGMVHGLFSIAADVIFISARLLQPQSQDLKPL